MSRRIIYLTVTFFCWLANRVMAFPSAEIWTTHDIEPTSAAGWGLTGSPVAVNGPHFRRIAGRLCELD